MKAADFFFCFSLQSIFLDSLGQLKMAFPTEAVAALPSILEHVQAVADSALVSDVVSVAVAQLDKTLQGIVASPAGQFNSIRLPSISSSDEFFLCSLAVLRETFVGNG